MRHRTLLTLGLSLALTLSLALPATAYDSARPDTPSS